MGTRRILICDDEPLLRELMRVTLGSAYAYEEAATVEEAIEAARRFRPDIALIDVMMPGGSGLEIVRYLRNQPKLQHARSVIVSAFSDAADRRAAEEAGADAFVAKPFDPTDLSATVEALLAAPA